MSGYPLFASAALLSDVLAGPVMTFPQSWLPHPTGLLAQVAPSSSEYQRVAPLPSEHVPFELE